MTPIRATWSFFSDVKNDVLTRITERSKDDYDNDVSDNCDHNFGTFDDFGVKNTKKYHIIMIDDGLFVAARCVENKTIKDFQRCISLHKQLPQSRSSCKKLTGIKSIH